MDFKTRFATGFFYEFNEETYLITARHNFGDYDSSELEYKEQPLTNDESDEPLYTSKVKAYFSESEYVELSLEDDFCYTPEAHQDLVAIRLEGELPQSIECFDSVSRPENGEIVKYSGFYAPSFISNPYDEIYEKSMRVKRVKDQDKHTNKENLKVLEFLSGDEPTPGMSGGPFYLENKLVGVFTHGVKEEGVQKLFYWGSGSIQDLFDR